MAIIQEFNQLKVWQEAHILVIDTYHLIEKDFPKSEVYGLSSQLKRSIVSIPANIAEGFKKRSWKDKLRFYNIAEASLEESKYYFILAQDLGFSETKNISLQAERTGYLLRSLIKSIKDKNNP